ncbi:MAG: diguanylate cyclase [Xanthomonadaceae bacterium]|nr:diguanylate cyclase [Xanthomonadaceae bacterium]
MSRAPWLAMLALTMSVHCQDAGALDRDRPFQDLVADRWSVEHGLPQVTVYAIAQDDGGYLWVGTQKGIARFDGHRFVAYGAEQGIGATPTNVAHAVRAADGTLWFLHDRGLLSYRDGVVTRHEDRLPGAGAVDLAVAPDGLLLATRDGLQRIVDGTRAEQVAGTPAIGSVVVDASGRTWLGAGAAILEQQGSRWVVHPLPATDGASLAVTALAAGPERLWVGTTNGLYAFDQREARFAPIEGTAGAAIAVVLATASGEVWAGGPDSLFRTHDGHRAVRIDTALLGASPWITALFEDRDFNLWVGTRTDGLMRLSDGWIDRKILLHADQPQVAWSVERAPDGSLLAGSERGVYRIASAAVTRIVPPGDLPNPVAYELAFDDRDRLWIGTRSGLARRAYPDGAVETLADFAGLQVNAIVHGSAGTSWFGTHDGLVIGDHDAFERVAIAPGTPANRVRGVLPEADGSLLLATEGGVRRWREGRVETPAWAAPVDQAFVTAVDRLAPDMLLVSTVDRGFGVVHGDALRMVADDPTLRRLTAWGARTTRGQVFLSSAEGIVTFPLEQLRRFAVEGKGALDWRVPASIDGNLRGSVRARCCNGGGRSRIAIDDYRVWLPTIESVIAIDLDDLDRAVETPVPHIESVASDDVRRDVLADRQPVVLSGDRRDLAVAYTAIAHRDPKGLRFFYRLDGFDADWVDAGVRREAFYTNLPAGRFTFRVRAESAARIGSAQDATIEVTVPPRWHERTGSRVGLLLLVLAGALLAALATVRWREKAYAMREARLRAEVEQRTMELAHANAELRDANRALAQESETDPLTGLPNRRWLLNHLGEWLRGADGATGEDDCALLLMFDLDRFKDINARHGHAAGDALLRQFGASLRQSAGPDGTVVRWGGEEFLLVQRGVPRAQSAARVVALWRAAQEHLHPAPDGTPIVLPSSVGYSLWPLARGATGVPWSVALEMADAAAWRVHAEARNGWGGLLLADGADPALLSGGIVGRLDALLRGGVLVWERIGAGARPPA